MRRDGFDRNLAAGDYLVSGPGLSFVDEEFVGMVVADIRRTSPPLAGNTFRTRAASRAPRPSSSAARMRPIWNGVVLGLPRRLPAALARPDGSRCPTLAGAGRGRYSGNRSSPQARGDAARAAPRPRRSPTSPIKVWQGSAQPADAPRDHEVELPPATDPFVAVNGHHGPAKPRGGLLQGV